MTDLVAIAEEYHVDYWRLWLAVADLEAVRCSRPTRLGPRPRLTVPAHPLFARYTVAEIATAIGCDRGNVHRWRILRRLHADQAELICDALGITPCEVWGKRWHAIQALIAEGVAR